MAEGKQSTLWGLPIVIRTDEDNEKLAEEVSYLIPLPTARELISSGLSLQEWIEQHPKRACKVKIDGRRL